MQRFYQHYLYFSHLSWQLRLFAVLGSFALLECLIVYLTVVGNEKGVSSILVFPGILAALLFPWRKAFALEWGLLWVYLGVNVCFKGFCPSQITAFATGTFLDFFIIATVGFLRYAWELTEKLASVKDQLIANVSHELKTPLANILGSLDILRSNGNDMSQEDRDMFFEQAIFAGSELQRLTDNILDSAQADDDVSPPIKRVFCLDCIVFDILRHVDTQDHQLCIDIPDGLAVEGDSQQVGQVMRNLLSNCFKYSPKGTPVSIQMWDNSDDAYVCVQDRGPGIAPEQISLLFQKFSRLPRDVAKSIRGVGLGLYICRRLIENMGGSIWAESSGIPGQGTSFIFTLPCAIAEDTHNHRKWPALAMKR